MTLGGNKLAVKYLDPDLCFMAWIIFGSASMASTKLYKDGITHPVTGNPPSKMGITYAAKESIFYREYMERRVADPKMPSTPTREEYMTAQVQYATLLGDQQERVKVLREQFGTVEYAVED